MLTFDQLKKRVGKNLKYYDDTDGWKTGRDVTETDIGDFINEVYIEDLFPYIQTRYPQYFSQKAKANSWIASGTGDASSTGSTLVATTSIFNNSMVGLKIYNETDSETTEITGYTNATTVTVEDTIGDTWDGDSIFVLGQEFAIGSGNIADHFEIEEVSLKFNTSDTYYRRAISRDLSDFEDYGSELATELRPYYYLTTVDVAGVPTTAIGILPKFENKISNAILVEYTEIPTELSGDSDKARIPTSLPLIYGATMRAYEKMQDFSNANYWTSKYEMSKRKMISNFSFSKSNKIRVKRKFSLIHQRYH